jgi:hypothetical protein
MDLPMILMRYKHDVTNNIQGVPEKNETIVVFDITLYM